MHMHQPSEKMLENKNLPQLPSRLAIPLVTISYQISTGESIVVRPTLAQQTIL